MTKNELFDVYFILWQSFKFQEFNFCVVLEKNLDKNCTNYKIQLKTKADRGKWS